MLLAARRSAAAPAFAFALLAGVLLAAPLAAQNVRVLTLTAGPLTPLFATTSPVVDVIDFRAPTPAEIRSGWVLSSTTTVVDDRARVPHSVTIVALNECGRGAASADDNEATSDIQWSVDGDHTWHDLTSTPRELDLRGTARPVHLRYRRRVRPAATACMIRAQLTPIPRR